MIGGYANQVYQQEPNERETGKVEMNPTDFTIKGADMKAHAVRLIALACLMVTAPAMPGEFPDDWFWERGEEHTKFEGTEAPALTVGEWVAGEFDVTKMRGSIVIVDFWATWCGPCIAAMPKNNALAEKYAKDGVKLIGVCASGDPATMPKILTDNKVTYPNAFVQGEQVTKDWPILFYPTYAVIDREGIVRAIGLKPDKVEAVIESMLAEEADKSGKVRVRPTWLEGDSEKRARLARLEKENENPPALTVDTWHNSEPLELEKLKGKVVVLDFWATWNPSNDKSIPRNKALLEKFDGQDLVLIGVCATAQGKESIEKAIEQHGIDYPVCVDIDNKTTSAYSPNGYSDYYIIDRAGKLRIADCANAKLEEAVEALLNEKIDGDGDGDANAVDAPDNAAATRG